MTVTGTAAPAAISIMDGEYSTSGGTANPDTIRNGQSVVVRLTSLATYATTKTAVLTIGEVGAAFCVLGF